MGGVGGCSKRWDWERAVEGVSQCQVKLAQDLMQDVTIWTHTVMNFTITKHIKNFSSSLAIVEGQNVSVCKLSNNTCINYKIFV